MAGLCQSWSTRIGSRCILHVISKVEVFHSSSSPRLAGPIVVLFLLLTSGVVLYALTLWAPQADEEFGVEANQQNNRVNQPGNFDSPNLNEEVNGRQREILNMEIKASDKHREEPSESTLNRQLVALRGKIGKKTTTSIFRI